MTGPRQALSAKVREHAVRDVLTGRMSLVLAAATWGVRADDLRRWVAAATHDRR